MSNSIKCFIMVGVAIILLLSGSANAEKFIDSCQNITLPGTYVLNQNIMNSSESPCIYITSGDVIFDGAGHTIDGIFGNPYDGLYVSNSTLVITNVTIKNLTVTDWNRGIELFFVDESHLINNIANNNSADGITLFKSNNNELIYNRAQFNNFDGIGVGYSSNNNVSENMVTNNKYGIAIYSLNGYSDPSRFNELRDNNANSNTMSGIRLLGCFDPNNPNTYWCTYNNTLSGNMANFNGNFGIEISNSVNNILENNYEISNYGTGIILFRTMYNQLTSNNASFNEIDGIYLSNYNKGNKLTNNTITFNKIKGLDLWAAYNNQIFNNFLNNNNNIDLKSVIGNDWNVTKTSGTNIIGGSYLGGNFWAYPNGTGFSQTCSDSNSDGICDSPYALDSNNTDYLPLAHNSATPLPTLSVSSSPTNVTVGTATDVTFTVTPALSDVLVSLSGAGVSVNGTTTSGTVTISVNATVAGIITATASMTGYTGVSIVLIAQIAIDTTPPESITNLTMENNGTSWIKWNWTNPISDFSYVAIWINNGWHNAPVGANFFNMTGLLPGTEYTIATHTVDTSGNVNLTWVNLTSSTLPNTPLSASPITVILPLNSSVTFESVSVAGNTVETLDDSGHQLPASSYIIVGNYHNIFTTAIYNPPLTVSVNYNIPLPSGYTDSDVRLYHWNDSTSQWDNVTTSSGSGTVTGLVSSLSPFVPAIPANAPSITGVTITPTNPSTGNEINITVAINNPGASFNGRVEGNIWPPSGTGKYLGWENLVIPNGVSNVTIIGAAGGAESSYITHQAGTYLYDVYLENVDKGQVYTNPTDSKTGVPFTVGAAASVYISNIVLSASPTNGSVMTLKVTISNPTASAFTGTMDANIWDSMRGYVLTPQSISIAAGGSTTLIFSYTPVNHGLHSYDFFMVSDISGDNTKTPWGFSCKDYLAGVGFTIG